MANKGIVLAKINPATDPQTNPSASQQRMFLHENLGWGYLDDSNAFTPFGTGAGSSDEVYIDTLPLPLTSYPSKLIGMFKRYLSFVSKQDGSGIDTFVSKHLARVFKRDALGNYTSSDQSFANISEIESYIDTNFANDGSIFSETGYVLFYDKVSSSIPTLTNASGVNSTFNSLASGNYKNHSQTAGSCSFYDSTMAVIFNLLHGTAFTAGDFGNTNARSSFWLPRNYNLYNRPYIYSAVGWKTHIKFQNMNSQRYQENAGVFSIATDADWVVTGCYLATFDELGNFINVYDFRTQSERFNFARDVSLEKYRYISFYGLESVTKPLNKAVIVKPVGVDQITIEMFDQNVYDLEVVSRGNTDNSIYEDTVTINPLNADTGSNRIRLDIKDWMINISNMSKHGLTTRGLPDLYFRLRDKTTGEVGKLSDFYIHTINQGNCGNGQTTLGFVIKNDKK